MKKIYYLLIACSALIFSCKSVNKAYQKGNYTDAIEIGIRKLQKDPYDYETRDLVKKAYQYAVEQHEDQVRIHSASGSDLRYDRIYQEYVFLQDLYYTIRESPVTAEYIKAKDYSAEMEEYRNLAAIAHYEKAQRWFSEDRKEAYQEAYREMLHAIRFRPDDYEWKKFRDTAYDRAITKILVLTQDQYNSFRYTSNYQMNHFTDDIMRMLASNMSGSFMRFYSEWEAHNRNIVPDQIMEIRLNRIVIGQPYEQQSNRQVSQEVVVKEIVYRPDSVVKQYGKVYANIMTTRRTSVSQGDLLISIRDTRGRVIWTDTFTGEHRHETEFYSYTGDERALSSNDKALVNRPLPSVPRQDEIVNNLFRQIRSDLSHRLRNYWHL